MHMHDKPVGNGRVYNPKEKWPIAIVFIIYMKPPETLYDGLALLIPLYLPLAIAL